MEKQFKIGFSNVGGIFIGRGINSKFHKHYAITFLIAFDKPFKLTTKEGSDFYYVALIQKNIDYSLETSKTGYTAFIHIVPYSEMGISLSGKCPIEKLDILSFRNILEKIKNWFESPDSSPQIIEHLIRAVSLIPENTPGHVIIDERVLKSLSLIMESDLQKLPVKEIADKAHLSVSHFNRIFKKETGLTFRQFVLHRKLIKSVYAMYEKKNLTAASFIGGFSDQAHLTRTFRENFGIKPSETLK